MDSAGRVRALSRMLRFPIMKVAIVTGAAQGIGRRTAEVLAARGYSLVLSDRRPCGSDLAAIEIIGDVSLEETAQRIRSAVHERFGQADVLVNNAGISYRAGRAH